MEFEVTQFSDDLLDPAPQEESTPVSDEPAAPSGAQEDPITEGVPEVTEGTAESTSTEPELNAYEQFLKARGVRDGKTIVYEDEDTGETSEVDFTTLATEEQLSILNELADPGLSEDEINTIEFLRKNNATMQDVIDYYSEQAVKEYIEKNGNAPAQVYSVDQYSDDELYLADLRSRYTDMTDEELASELEAAKYNEELFKKKVDIIRSNFKTAEENERKEAEAAQQKQREEYQSTFKNTLDQFNYIPMDYRDPDGGAMQVENAEKAAIWEYIFKQDAQGMTGFTRDLNDPQRVIEMAWRMLYGAEAMSDMTQYWKGELKKTRRAVTTEPTKPKASVTTVVKDSAKQKTAPAAFANDNYTSLNPGWGNLL